MKLKHVLFDFDGVLADSERGAFSFLQRTLAEVYGVTVPDSEQLRYIGHGGPGVAQDIVTRYRLNVTPEEFLAQRRKYGNFYENSKTLEPMPHAVEFLRILQENGVKTAVVSSTASRLILTALDRMQLLRCFDVIVCGDMVEQTKPAPDSYLKALSLLGARAEESVAFEDSPVGIAAARSAGLTVVGFTGSGIPQDISAAHMQAASFAECFALSRLEALLDSAGAVAAR